MLASSTAPSRATLRDRAIESTACHDKACIAYTLLLSRAPTFRLGAYEGSAAALKSTSGGGRSVQRLQHLSALADGQRTVMIDMIRAYPGELAFFSGWRMDVSAIDKRCALLAGARVAIVHLVEVR